MTLERRLPQDARVLLLENIHADANALLSKAGYQVETEDRALAEEELVVPPGRYRRPRHQEHHPCDRPSVVVGALTF